MALRRGFCHRRPQGRSDVGAFALGGSELACGEREITVVVRPNLLGLVRSVSFSQSPTVDYRRILDTFFGSLTKYAVRHT